MCLLPYRQSSFSVLSTVVAPEKGAKTSIWGQGGESPSRIKTKDKPDHFCWGIREDRGEILLWPWRVVERRVVGSRDRISPLLLCAKVQVGKLGIWGGTLALLPIQEGTSQAALTTVRRWLIRNQYDRKVQVSTERPSVSIPDHLGSLVV